ncbi:MAG TPA: hypothetical protein VEI94_07265 [Candidatus Bathyarchaeia archaeon]|nr:hypothetical protein [Candidatus Bathyarchaeia archaeon]
MIHELGERFAERNLFLQVALGMVSLSQRFDALLVEHGFASRAGESLASHPDERPDEPVLLFLLGLASFSGRAMQHLDGARRSAPPRAREPRARGDGLESELRKLLV